MIFSVTMTLMRRAAWSVAVLSGLTFAGAVQAADILCPEAETAADMAIAPGDIATVQADIERINLCVERAQLLRQLDEVVKARQKILEESSAPSMVMPGGNASGGLGIAVPPISNNTLPNVRGIQQNNDLSDLRPGEVRINAPQGVAPLGGVAESVVAVPSWSIRKIWGQGAAMRAQLTDGSGTIMNIIKGDPLPDGAVVENVSVKGVTISRNGKVTDLSWEQVAELKK